LLDDVTRVWRRLHNEELQDLYPHKIILGDEPRRMS